MAAMAWGLFVALCATSFSVEANRPKFPAPPDSNVSQVGQNMLINGRRTDIRMFSSADAVDEVLLYYRELWAEPVAKGGPGFAAEDVAMRPWRLLTRVEDGWVMTVQVQPGNEGSWGYLAVSKMPRNGKGEVSAPPPAPSNSTVISDIRHDDPGQAARTAVIKNNLSVSANVSYYRNQYADWREDADRAVSDGRVHALRYTRGRDTVTITIQGDRAESEVVINEVSH